MNKKMQEILEQIQNRINEARQLQDAGKVAAARAKLDEISGLREEYNTEKTLYELEQQGVPNTPAPQNDINGFEVMCKVARGAALTEAEAALITGGASGEDYIVPEDVRTEIIKLRRRYPSVRDIINVIPTTSIRGSFNFEAGGLTALTNFDDGQELTPNKDVKIAQKPFSCSQWGEIIGISNRLLGVEKAELLSYLNTWFVRKAVLTENLKTFQVLTTDKTAKALVDVDQLRRSMIIDVDDALADSVVIATNSYGVAWLAEQKDDFGRSLLIPDPTNPMIMRFNGAVVHKYPTSHLPNVGNTAPMFYGSLFDGCYMLDSTKLRMATSDHVYFGKNQSALRIIEDFDVIQADADAYQYGVVDVSEFVSAATE